MTYNSYSNYQRMHSCSSSTCMDGVPMAISEKFRPPPRVKLPKLSNRHVCDIIEKEYDFSLERQVLAEAESRRMVEIADQEACRVACAMDDLSRSDSPENKPKDPGKKDEITWTLGPEILTPMTTSKPIEVGTKSAEKSSFRVKDFETVDDPFDDLELKVLDDMAELKSVLDVVQQSTSPTLKPVSPTAVENEKLNCEGTNSGAVQPNPIVHSSPVANSVENVKRKPVNLDDYNISLPNTDHLISTKASPADMRQYVTGNTMTQFPVQTCPTQNGFRYNNGFVTQQAVIGSKSDTNTVIGGGSAPAPAMICGLSNGTASVIGRWDNGTGAMVGAQTFDDYRYSGYKMRSAKSASDLSRLGTEESNTYRISHSPPPRNPYNQNPAPPTGRHSLAGVHPPLTNQRSLPSGASPAAPPRPVTSLTDPFTGLGVEDQDFVCMFVDMGFPRPRTARAVQTFGKDAKQVTDFLCLCDGLVEQGYPPDHVELAAQLGQNQIKQAKEYLKVMRQLEELGFAHAEIHKALHLHRADTDKCLDFLTAPT